MKGFLRKLSKVSGLNPVKQSIPDFKEWAKLYQGEYELLQEGSRVSVEQPSFSATIHRKLTFSDEYAYPPQEVATIKNGRVIGADCAILTEDYKLLLNVSHQFNTKLDRRNHSIFKRLMLPKVKRLKGVAAVIGSAGSYNYYHWMLDILPRYDILKKSKYFPAIDYFIINELDRPFQKETLAALEIPAEKLVYINESTHLQVDQLLVPSLTKYRELTPLWVIKFLKELILPREELSVPTPVGDRIYITRGKANNRKIVNEGEVIELLKAYDFEVLSLEDFTVYQQAKIFQQAKVLIAPHGASQTNLVFCEDRTKVMEFFSPAWVHHCYYALSLANKLDYHFLLDESTENTGLSATNSPEKGQDIFVELSGLQKFLECL